MCSTNDPRAVLMRAAERLVMQPVLIHWCSESLRKQKCLVADLTTLIGVEVDYQLRNRPIKDTEGKDGV